MATPFAPTLSAIYESAALAFPLPFWGEGGGEGVTAACRVSSLSLFAALALLLTTLTASAADDDFAYGRRLYLDKAQCAYCHGWAADGAGEPQSNGGAANLRDTKMNRDQLVETHGRLDPLIKGLIRDEMARRWWRYLLVSLPLAWCGMWVGGWFGLARADFAKAIGQQITVEAVKARDGSLYGYMDKIKLPDGTSYQLLNGNEAK